MKRLLEFKAFESLSVLTEDQKAWINKSTSGIWSIGGDGKVNIDGSFYCQKQSLSSFNGIKFGRVSENFFCNENQLESLDGAPQTVGNEFYCYNNKLKSLKGGPQMVGGNFYCERNQLRNLKGAPQIVGKSFFCEKNNLESLEGAPWIIGETFYSDHVKVFGKGEWGPRSWVKIIENGNLKDRELMGTLISPDVLNKRLEESPETTMVALKGIWNSPEFSKIRSQLKIPKGYEDEMDLLGDLDDIGL
jgi:hypothetical protein